MTDLPRVRVRRRVLSADDIRASIVQAQSRLESAKTPKEEREVRLQLREENAGRIFVNAKPYWRRPARAYRRHRRMRVVA